MPPPEAFASGFEGDGPEVLPPAPLPGVTFLVWFFVFGTTMCLLTLLTLLFPGSILEPLWKFKVEARAELGSMGGWALTLMFVVGAACALSALGLRRRAEWGRRLAIAVLSLNVIGDLGEAILRHDPTTLIGIPIGGAMIWYLMSGRVRGAFHLTGTH